MTKRLTVLALLLSVSVSASSRPDDHYFTQQWGLSNDGSQTVLIDLDDLHSIEQKGVAGVDIGWLEAQDEVKSRAKAPVIVAVIDSGVDLKHPDLKDRLTEKGWDFLTGSGGVSDILGHGTHVAGIIVANADNGIGIAGVAPSSVKVLPIRILSDQFKDFAYKNKLISDYAAEAVKYAVDNGASVINMSLGWPKLVDTAKARKAIQDAVQKGVLVVVAAGNDRKDEPTYPCAYEGVLCVGSVSNDGQRAYYSNGGGLVDVLAPGDGIMSLYPLKVESRVLRIQGYERLSGTSQAAPMIAGLAATLKSVWPEISLNELKARILKAAMPLDSSQMALFGVPRLPRALNVSPSPVYLPNFKTLDAVLVDEASTEASGVLSFENLWQAADGVVAEVFMSGRPVGSVNVGRMESGAKVTIPWKSGALPMESASDLVLKLKISDASGSVNEFSTNIVAVRAMDKISGVQAFQIPQVNGKNPDWIGGNLGGLFTRLKTVNAYPRERGTPRYYSILAPAEGKSQIQIYDPASETPISVIRVPQLQTVTQVIRIDLDRDGSRDWAVAGVGKRQDGTVYFQFYFLNSKLEPLYGAASTWQLDLNNALGSSVIRSYAQPSSWIRHGDRLVPSFATMGQLPDPDNFGALDPRRFVVEQHLYYLLPVSETADANGVVKLQARALDSAAFRKKNPGVGILNTMPGSELEQADGHFRLFLGQGDGLDAEISVWDIRSTTQHSIEVASDWNAIGANGVPVMTLTGDAGAYLNFYDRQRGSLFWTDFQGRLLERTEFSFVDRINPLISLVGAYGLSGQGRVWFVESNYDLVAYRQSADGRSLSMRKLPIERDSTFMGSQFSEMLNAVMVGTAERPLPGVYVDSSLVRGNRVSVAVFDPANDELNKPVRYSMQIPANCVQMAPVQLDPSAPSFAVPLFCRVTDRIEFRLVRP